MYDLVRKVTHIHSTPPLDDFETALDNTVCWTPHPTQEHGVLARSGGDGRARRGELYSSPAAGLTLGWLAGLVGTRLWPAWRGLGPCTQRGGRCVTCISTYGRERTGRVRSFSPRRSKVRRCRSRAGRDAGAQPVAGIYVLCAYVLCGLWLEELSSCPHRSYVKTENGYKTE